MTTKAFTEGYHAGYRGDMNNPYPLGSQEYKDWSTGYQEARIDMANGR